MELRIGPAGSPLGWSNSELYAEAEIERTYGSKPNKAKAKIYNLNPISRQFVEQSGNVLQIVAGEPILAQCFYGDIASRGVVHKHTRPNWITEFDAADGRRRFREARFIKSYPPGVTLQQILPDVILALQLPVGYQATLRPMTFSNGYFYAGKARHALTELLAPVGGYWDIQNGALRIMIIGQPEPGNVPLIAANTGLIGSPEKTDKGVNFTAIYNAAIQPGRGVQLKSKVVNALLRVTKLTHRLSSDGILWETAVQGVSI